MMERIHVLLPVHNRRETTRRFVECLNAQTHKNYHLILIDDGSVDGTADMVREVIPDATVIRGKGDWWWAGSLQRGLDWLRQSSVEDEALVMFANDDTTFPSDFFDNAIQVLREEQRCMLLPRIRNARTGALQESGVYADLRKMNFRAAEGQEPINCFSTRGLFLRWSDIRVAGNFHPTLLPHYWSDYEYTIRAGRKGLAFRTTDAVWLDANLGSTGDRSLESAVGLEFFRRYFSVRYSHNPVFVTSFVLLAVPVRWMLPNFLRIWGGALRQVFLQGILKCRTDGRSPLQ